MDINENKISRGRVLHLVAKTNHLSIKEIARKAGFKNSTFFTHIKQPNLSFAILARYGRAMDHDFSDEFPEITDVYINAKDFLVPYKKKLSYEELSKEHEDLRDKYYAHLEKHHKLLEKIIDLMTELDSLKNSKKDL